MAAAAGGEPRTCDNQILNRATAHVKHGRSQIGRIARSAAKNTHAALLIAAGVHPKAIQARLGHASITTTLNIYGHLMPSAFQGVGDRVEAVLEGNRKATEVEVVEDRGLEPARALAGRG